MNLDIAQPSGLFWATVFGVAVGIVAGTLIQYFITLILEEHSDKSQKLALIKEMKYNKLLAAELRAEVTNLRNAINGDVLNTYWGFFHFGKGLFIQANASASNGLLYKLLTAEELRNIQKVVAQLSVGTEKWFNNEITRLRNVLINTPHDYSKPSAVAFVGFIETQINEVDDGLDQLIEKLDG